MEIPNGSLPIGNSVTIQRSRSFAPSSRDGPVFFAKAVVLLLQLTIEQDTFGVTDLPKHSSTVNRFAIRVVLHGQCFERPFHFIDAGGWKQHEILIQLSVALRRRERRQVRAVDERLHVNPWRNSGGGCWRVAW
jgi:hypothetical protein